MYNVIVASCYRNRDKLLPDGPLGPNADFTYHPKRQVRNFFFSNFSVVVVVRRETFDAVQIMSGTQPDT